MRSKLTFLLVLLLLAPPIALATKKLVEAPCLWLFKQKKWAQAARCFASKAQALPAAKKYYRGRLLRNAALLWNKAAATGPKDKVAIRLQRSILYFRTYTQNKMCLDAALCQQAGKQLARLCQQAGCGTLQITTKPAFASIVLHVGSWSSTKRGRWLATEMPPGPYALVVSAPGMQTKRLTLRLDPKKRHHLQISLLPPQVRPGPRVRAPVARKVPVRRKAVARRKVAVRKKLAPAARSAPVFGWIGVIGGAVLLAGGGALLAGGHASFAGFKQSWDDPALPAPTPQAQDAARSQSDAMAVSGITMLSVGGALALSGVIAFFVGPKARPSAVSTSQANTPKGDKRQAIGGHW